MIEEILMYFFNKVMYCLYILLNVQFIEIIKNISLSDL